MNLLLRYAASVKRIKTSAFQNLDAAQDDIIDGLRKEIAELKDQLASVASTNLMSSPIDNGETAMLRAQISALQVSTTCSVCS